MDKKTIITMKKMFDDIMHTTEDGTVEFCHQKRNKAYWSGIHLQIYHISSFP